MTRGSHDERLDARGAWSTPLDAPLYPRYPIPFRDIELLTLEYRTDSAAIRRLVPEPLEPTGDSVLLHVARMGDVPGFGAWIHECNVMVGVRLYTAQGVVTGCYSPWFFLDSDRAIAQDREVQGQPKRAAVVDLETRGDLVVGTAIANGIEVLTVTHPYKQRPGSFDELRSRVDMVTNINLKLIPNMDGTVAIRQLVARNLETSALSSAGPARARSRSGRTRPCDVPAAGPRIPRRLPLASPVRPGWRTRRVRLPGAGPSLTARGICEAGAPGLPRSRRRAPADRPGD